MCNVTNRCLTAEGQTLGFHFDERKSFCELICGVTICGQGRFLLSPTSGSEAISAKQLTKDNVAVVELQPLSLYVMTGMSRYDLRHAVVQEGSQERISVTFRSLASPKGWIATKRAQVELMAATPHA